MYTYCTIRYNNIYPFTIMYSTRFQGGLYLFIFTINERIK